MDIRRLSHILALADQRNFARAAELLHISQPALTRSIQAAEAEYDLRLFDRGPTEVTPTAAGLFVLERARHLVFDSRCLARDMHLYRDRALGDTAFGVGPLPAASFLAGMLADLRRSHPHINLRVEVGNWEVLSKRLHAEDIEFFVADVRDLPPDPTLSVRLLHRASGGFYVRNGHPLAGQAEVSLADLWSHGIASVRLPQAVQRVLADQLNMPPASKVQLALECDDVNTLKQVALDTSLVLAISHSAVTLEVAQGRLKPLNIPGLPHLFAEMGIVTLRGRTPSPMASLIQGSLPGWTASA